MPSAFLPVGPGWLGAFGLGILEGVRVLRGDLRLNLDIEPPWTNRGQVEQSRCIWYF